MGTTGFGEIAGALRNTSKGNWRRQRRLASLDERGAPAANSDTYAYAEPNCVDLTQCECFAVPDSFL